MIAKFEVMILDSGCLFVCSVNEKASHTVGHWYGESSLNTVCPVAKFLVLDCLVLFWFVLLGGLVFVYFLVML